MIAEKTADAIRGRKLPPFEPPTRYSNLRHNHYRAPHKMPYVNHQMVNHRTGNSDAQSTYAGFPDVHGPNARGDINKLNEIPSDLPSPLAQSLDLSQESLAMLAQNLTNIPWKPNSLSKPIFGPSIEPRSLDDKTISNNYDSSHLADSLIKRFGKFR